MQKHLLTDGTQVQSKYPPTSEAEYPRQTSKTTEPNVLSEAETFVCCSDQPEITIISISLPISGEC